MDTLQQKRKLLQSSAVSGEASILTDKEAPDTTKLRRRGSSSQEDPMMSSKLIESKYDSLGLHESDLSSDDSSINSNDEMIINNTSTENLAPNSLEKATNPKISMRPGIIDIKNITEDFNFLGSPRSTSKNSSDQIGKKQVKNKPALTLFMGDYDNELKDHSPIKKERRNSRKNRRTSWHPSFKNPGNLILDLVEVDKETSTRGANTDSRAAQDAYKSVCSKVTEFLFVGGFIAAQKKQELFDLGITHVINCSGNNTPNYFPDAFHYFSLPLNDHNSEDITKYFYNIIEFIENTRLAKGKVFLHCVKGISRSPAMAMAYLIWFKNFTYEEAFKFLKNARPVVNPNPGFIFQICEWSHNRIGKLSHTGVHKVDILETEINGIKTIKPLIVGPLTCIDHKAIHFPSDEISKVCLLISSKDSLYIWCGPFVNESHLNCANEAASQICQYELQDHECETIHAGGETESFWNILGEIRIEKT